MAWAGSFTVDDAPSSPRLCVRFSPAQAGARVAVLLLHGANASSASFSSLAPLLAHTWAADVFAYDCRGHGDSGDGDEPTIDALVRDALRVVAAIVARLPAGAPLILWGHSMGGVVAAKAASSVSALCPLAGIIIEDVVPGTALASLAHMRGILSRIPRSFSSTDEAIAWALSSGTLRCEASARVSIPHALTRKGPPFVWRAAPFLDASATHWSQWFHGASACFIAARAPAKALLLARADALVGDAALLAGQMSGAFQVGVVGPAGSVGHTLHEDAPQACIAALGPSFIARALSRAGVGAPARR